MGHPRKIGKKKEKTRFAPQWSRGINTHSNGQSMIDMRVGRAKTITKKEQENLGETTWCLSPERIKESEKRA